MKGPGRRGNNSLVQKQLYNIFKPEPLEDVKVYNVPLALEGARSYLRTWVKVFVDGLGQLYPQ